MKGARLFDQLTAAQIAPLPGTPATSKKKGRAADLIEERNKCLLLRFHFHAKVKRLRYDDVLKTLSSEFFISERTIAEIIAKESEFAKDVFTDESKLKSLQKRYSFLSWSN